MNERMLLVGYEIEKKEMNLVNLMLNYAQFIIYRNYIRNCFGNENRNMHALYLFKELKAEIRSYLSLKCNKKKFQRNEVEKLLSVM